jgi:Putative Actinobacterial Holin-X, holin superfamily III
MTFSHPRSVPQIVSDLFSQLAMLMHTEAQLARAEISGNMVSIGRGLGLVIGGAVLLIPAIVILLEAGAVALADRYDLTPYWSGLLLGGITLIIGAILLFVGLRHLRVENVIPGRTVNQLQQDASVAKEQVSQDNEQRRAA